MTIFLSTGPVISTRRSARAAGVVSTLPLRLADGGRLGSKVGQLSRIIPSLRHSSLVQDVVDAGRDCRARDATKATASGVRMLAYSGSSGPRTRTPAGREAWKSDSGERAGAAPWSER